MGWDAHESTQGVHKIWGRVGLTHDELLILCMLFAVCPLSGSLRPASRPNGVCYEYFILALIRTPD